MFKKKILCPMNPDFGYAGCGSGWVEFTPTGEPIAMRYADSVDADGSVAQSGALIDFSNYKKSKCLLLKNGNLRILANFSCTEAMLAFWPTKWRTK